MNEWRAIADLNGLFDVRDACRGGLSARDLIQLERRGEIIRLFRGWYSLPLPPLPPELAGPAERRRQLHRAQAKATLKAYADRAVISHHSALVLRSLPIFGADLRQVHITRTSDRQSRRRPGLVVHKSLPGVAVESGVIDASVAIVQAGMTNGPMAALIAADAALHRSMVSRESLTHACVIVRGPLTRSVRALLTQVDERSESPGETRLRHAVGLMDLPTTPQFGIKDGAFQARVDLMLDGLSVVLEFDGFVKYGRARSSSFETTPADVVFAEKTREDHIRSLGYEVVRVTWGDLADLPALRRRIEAAISRATMHRVA